VGRRPVSRVALDSLGAICAMRWEADCLAAAPGGGPLAWVVGVGAGRAERGASVLVKSEPAGLLSFGCCAALSEHLGSGDWVLPERVMGSDGSVLAAHAPWRRAVLERWPDSQPATGLLAESNDVLPDAAAKRQLAEATGAHTADMESAAVARAAAAAGIPFLCLRVVLDDARTAVPAPLLQINDSNGSVRVNQVLAAVVHNPGLVPALWRLARARRRACAGLRAAARLLPAELVDNG